MKSLNLNGRHLLAISFLFFVPLITHAQREAGNGGDGIILQNGELRVLDLVRMPETVILDPEAAGSRKNLENMMSRNENFSQITYFPWFDTNAQPELLRPKDIFTVSFKDYLLSTLDSLNFYLVKGPLPELNDRGNVILPWKVKGKIVRLALQNRKNKTVLIDRDYYEKLSEADKPALLLHEILIRAWYNMYEDDLRSTEKIAAFVNVFFSNENASSSISGKSLVRYLWDIGLTVHEKSYVDFKLLNVRTLDRISYPESTLVFYVKNRRPVVVELKPDNAGQPDQQMFSDNDEKLPKASLPGESYWYEQFHDSYFKGKDAKGEEHDARLRFGQSTLYSSLRDIRWGNENPRLYHLDFQFDANGDEAAKIKDELKFDGVTLAPGFSVWGK